jgi:hypothetical protein
MAQLLEGRKDWMSVLPVAERVLNSAPIANRGNISAYEVVYGVKPEPLRSIGIRSKNKTVEEHLKGLENIHRTCYDHLVSAKVTQTYHANKHRKKATFDVTDQVLLSTEDINMKEDERFRPKFIGPFTITAKNDRDRYTLNLSKPYDRLHNEFHASKLKKFVNTEHNENEQPDPIVYIDGQPAWEVQDIVDIHESPSGQRKFKIKWKGYSQLDDSWEPEKKLANAAGMINAAIMRYNEVHGTKHPPLSR